MVKNHNNHSKTRNFLTALRVGFFLATRQVRRASIWTNALVIFIMVLTFLNLVVVSGILVGLVDGISQSVKEHFLGEIFISDLQRKSYIERSPDLIRDLSSFPEVESFSPRYMEGGTIIGNYKEQRKPAELEEEVGTSFVGIDPVAENKTTKLASLLVEGEYLNPDDYDQILLGSSLLKKYLDIDSANFTVLKDVEAGSKVLIRVNGVSREVKVKGVVKSKVDEIDRRAFFVDRQFRGLINRFDYNVDEIAVKLKPESDPLAVKAALINLGWDKYAKVQTQKDAEPKFVQDIRRTFDILGSAISSIGLVVAVITIFIIIFINAITRRKFIGILKGIGVSSLAIEIAYIFQSLFYAFSGIIIGGVVVFGFLKPYFDVHPIDFPFSNGILVAEPGTTAIRAVVLLLATLVAGYIPAKIVTRQNTLDAILNR
ncbi:ABC transporter permease [Candidatus Wolfebacteria bacterium]|nr:ABC transporter permease [Candidatus Wolfebacteria bacterium]